MTAPLFMGLHREGEKGTISGKNSPAKKIVELCSEIALALHSPQKGWGTEGRQEPGNVAGRAGPWPSPAERGASQPPGDTPDEKLTHIEFAFSLSGFSFSNLGVSHGGETLPRVQHPVLYSEPPQKITTRYSLGWQKTRQVFSVLSCGRAPGLGSSTAQSPVYAARMGRAGAASPAFASPVLASPAFAIASRRWLQ